jgi:hypothetical protein
MLSRCNSFGTGVAAGFLLDFAPSSTRREGLEVDLALKLNVLALCAVFLFVGAILLGAF